MKKVHTIQNETLKPDSLTQQQMNKIKGGSGKKGHCANELPKGSDKRKRPTG